MTIMKINQIWEELENDRSFSDGLVLRRYSRTFMPDVFVALKLPELFRCIATSISSSRKINLISYSNLQDISVELIPDESRSEKNILLLKLVSVQHQDIFSILCEDLITSISTITDEAQLVKELLSRFEKWQSLFDKVAAQGLSAEEQRGLYGELYFLRKLLQSNLDLNSVISSWVGPESGIKDFQSDNWGVEVKTTYGNNPKKIQISSEKQLDLTNFEKLFLYHISLEVKQNSGETLNEIVESITGFLSNDYISLNRFRNKLLEAGYFDQHRILYANQGYSIKKDIFYLVKNEFPRIEEKDIRNGVGDIKYSIIISQCSEYKVTEEQVFKAISFL